MSESTPAEKIQEQPELNTVYPLATKEPATSLSLMPIIGRMAMSPEFDVAKLQALLEVHEKWERRQAEKAFVAALAAFKKNPPEIIKNKKVSYTTTKGTTEYKHSTLDRVTASIGSSLGEHGLSTRWRTHQEGARIRVTCILQHEMGHAEETSLEASPDDSGSKNSIQAIGSAISYLERYTLLAATGMATRDDSDGITFGDAEDMVANLRSSANLDELQDRFNKVYKRAYAAKDKAAMAICIETKDQRKKELENPAARKAREEFDAKWEGRGVNLAGRQMAIGKASGDLAAADKELEERFPAESLATAPEIPPTPEPAAPKPAKGKTAKATKSATTEDAKPLAPQPEKPAGQDNLGF